MRLTIQKGNYKLSFVLAFSKVVEVEGINSLLPNGNHALLWDFDNVSLENIVTSLLDINKIWYLPSIYIVQSSDKGHYHAYCFASVSKPVALHILSSTRYICDTFFKMGVIRGYWTLRISNQKGNFKPVMILASSVPNSADWNQLESVQYKTVKRR